MDPAIASAAASMLAPYLAKAGDAAAKKAGELAIGQLGPLYQAIRRKFDRDADAYAQQTLARLEEQPTAEGRQQALATVLAEKAEGDPAFGQEVTRLVQGLSQDTAVVQVLTNVYGQARVRNITNIGQLGTLKID
jgi:hypothetical protein